MQIAWDLDLNRDVSDWDSTGFRHCAFDTSNNAAVSSHMMIQAYPSALAL